jgi:uncharacterized repeat protein (TIGR04042 family)
MPEMRFHIRWPDGRSETCYSPSLVIKDYFSVGTAYRLADFLERSRIALGIASDRVQEVRHALSPRPGAARPYRSDAGVFTDLADPWVTVDRFEE